MKKQIKLTPRARYERQIESLHLQISAAVMLFSELREIPKHIRKDLKPRLKSMRRKALTIRKRECGW